MDDIEIMRQAAKSSQAIVQCANAQAVAQQTLSVAQRLGYHSISLVKKNAGDGSGEVLYSNGGGGDIEQYRREGMVKNDPLVNRGLTSEFPQSGMEIASSRLSAAERHVLSYVAKAAGCADSLVIPVRRSASTEGVIVFGGLKPDTSPAARAALTILGHVAYGRISELTNGGDAVADVAPAIKLSPRETEVLGWVAKGKCDSEIAIILSMSERTARFHVANAKAKLDTTSRVQAVTKALELGLIAA
jgi:DNA-binding CsgD family transcriptional regulator